MRILGFDVRRAPPPSRREQRSLWSQLRIVRGLDNFTGAAGTEGGWISQRSAMGIPAVYLCVDKIAKQIATLPRLVMDATDPERPVPVRGTFVDRLMRVRPNSWQNGFVFWHLVSARQSLWGNFYAEIQRDRQTGEAIGLYPLISSEVEPELKAGRKVFNVAGRELSDEDVFHIMSPGWTGLKGMSPISLHRDTLAASHEMQRFLERFYQNGVRLSGFVKHPGSLEGDAIERLRSSIKDLWQGSSNAGEVGVLEEGMSFEPFSMPLGDAEFVATRRFQIADIARIFDMPLHKLGEMDGAKYNNVEQGNISYVIDCIEPRIEQIVQEANLKLFAEQDVGRLELRMPTEELLVGDLASRLQALGTARQWSIMTINESRAMLGLPSIGTQGDALFVPGNANAAAPVPGAPATTEE